MDYKLDYEFLSKTFLFRESSPNDIKQMLCCLDPEVKSYKKDEIIYLSGERISSMGLVLSGSVYIENNDFWGNHSIIDHVLPGFVFAETYSCLPDEPLMVTVRAAKDCDILFLKTAKVIMRCPNGCEHHNQLISNLLTISSKKNINLSRRILYTTPKSIRGKLISYLSSQATLHDSNEFDVLFNRQELADYLNVDRSALSNELSKMQKEGIISLHKNHFKLNKELE